jgi:transcriptional regulator with XRE-family HTH domain
MITAFGQMIKILRIEKGNIPQDKLASELGCSSSKLSNIMNGATEPDIPFLVKCQKYFGLDKEKTIELFTKSLSSHKTITLDTSYLIDNRKDLLVGIIAVLLFMPPGYDKMGKRTKDINTAIDTIIGDFKEFDGIRPLD